MVSWLLHIGYESIYFAVLSFIESIPWIFFDRREHLDGQDGTLV